MFPMIKPSAASSLAEEDRVHVARMLKIIVTGVTGAFILFFILRVRAGDMTTAWTLTAVLPFLWASLWLVRRGRPGFAAFVIGTSLLAAATSVCTRGQGIHDIVITAYPIILILTSLLLRRRSLVALLGIAIFSIAWLTCGETLGLYRAQPHGPGDFTDFLVVACLLGLTTLMAHLLSDGMWRSLRRARNEIADRQKAEAEMTRHLKEKEILLKEIHHRVKNNLQVVSSLLGLQAASLGDETASRLFGETRLRIRSMALVHEQLYQSKNLACIEFEKYLDRLLDETLRSLGAAARSVRLKKEFSPISLDVNFAIPLGLIVNELVTNSLKYAFPPGAAGEPRSEGNRLLLRLEPVSSDEWKLTIKDNGIGFPPGFDIRDMDSLGMNIVRGLAEQIGGSLDAKNRGGAEVSVVFRKAE
jgi:two-component sensor histidine kinase